MKEKDPSKIKSEIIRKRAKYLKESEEGKRSMCVIIRFYNQGKNEGMSEGFEAGKAEGIIKTIIMILKKKLGLMSEDILERIRSCSDEQLNQLTIEVSDFQNENEVRKFLIDIQNK